MRLFSTNFGEALHHSDLVAQINKLSDHAALNAVNALFNACLERVCRILEYFVF